MFHKSAMALTACLVSTLTTGNAAWIPRTQDLSSPPDITAPMFFQLSMAGKAKRSCSFVLVLLSFLKHGSGVSGSEVNFFDEF